MAGRIFSGGTKADKLRAGNTGRKPTLEEMLAIGTCQRCGNRNNKAHRMMALEEHLICDNCRKGLVESTLKIEDVQHNPYAPPRETIYRYG